MQSYLVTLNFAFSFGLYNPTLKQYAPGLPEEIAAHVPGMGLRCDKKAEDADETRTYYCELVVDADTEDGLVDSLIVRFSHLPGFDILGHDVKPVPVRPATKEFVVVCHFRSTEAFFRLSQAFDQHVSEGVLFPAPRKPGQYVAYVVICAPSSDGLNKAVENVLRTAFDAHSAETADHFTEVTTNLL